MANWPISLYKPDLEQLTDCNSSLDSDDDFHQIVDNSLSQNYPHLNDQTTQWNPFSESHFMMTLGSNACIVIFW